MICINIGLGNGEVVAHHVEGGVAEHELERPGVAAIAQEVDSEGMAESVDIDAGDTGALADASERLAQDVAIERLGFVGDEEWITGIGILAVGGDIAPEHLTGAGGERDSALTGALAKDLDSAILEIGVHDGQVAEFLGADTCIEEQENERTVTVGVGQGHREGALPRAEASAGLIEGSEHGLDIGFGIGQDSAFLRLRPFATANNVGGGEALVDGPGPEGRESGMVVEECLLRDGLGSQELADDGGGDGIERGIILEEVKELTEGILVIGDGLWGKAAGVGGEGEAVDRLREGESGVHI